MKRMMAAVLAALMLTGCAGVINSLSGNGPIAQARRDKYLQAHPDNKYAQQIRLGVLSVGMSEEDLQALYGSQCSISNTSSMGTFYQCQTNMLSDTTDPGTMVLVDNEGHVVSWIN
jgi:hypothetical protein